MNKAIWTFLIVGVLTCMALAGVACGNGDKEDAAGGEATNNPPIADAGNDESVVVGDIVYFSGTGTDSDGSVVKSEWDFDGDGTYDWNSDTTASTTHVYDTPGTYFAVLRVTDDSGNTDTSERVITVSQQSVASAEIIEENSYSSSYGYLYVVGVVKNTGDVNLNFVKITGTFYDASNNVVDTDFTYSDLDILTPQQESPFKLMLEQPAGYDHYSVQVSFSQTESSPYTDLTIQGVTDHLGSYGYYYINGEVTNTGTEAVTFVKLVAAMYDSTGALVDTDFTYTDPSDLSPGQTAPFEFMIDTDDLPGTIDNYELQVQCM